MGVAADPEGDGLVNDAEFALGTDPNNAADGHGGITMETSVIDGQTHLTLQFRSRSDDPDLTVTPELTPDLTSWSSDPAVFETLASIDQGDGYQLVTVRSLPAVPAHQSAFARVRITRIQASP